MHAFEPELSAPPPRRVRLRHRAHGWWLLGLRLFRAPFVTVGIGLALSALLGLALLLVGRRAEGLVLTCRDASDSESTRYDITYRFQAAGRSYQTSGHVKRSCEEGDPLRVVYLPWKPRADPVPLLGKDSLRRHVGGRWFFALFWNGILAPFLLMFWYAPLRVRALTVRGEPAAGTVIAKEPSSSDDGKPSGGTVRYEFCVPGYGPTSGETHGGSERADPAEYDATNVGDAVTILYDPARPKVSIAYRYSFYEVLPP